jgi:hypothetical protein
MDSLITVLPIHIVFPDGMPIANQISGVIGPLERRKLQNSQVSN